MDLRAPIRQRARLVDDNGIDATQRLKVQTTLDDRPKARRAADGAEDGERRAGCDAAGAGDDDHRDRRSQIVSDQIGHRGRPKGKIHEIAGKPIGESLHGSPRPLGTLDGLDDLAVTRVAADPVGAHLKSPRLVNRAREYRCASGLLDRHRFPGDARLVEERMAVEDRAVHWYAPAGID